MTIPIPISNRSDQGLTSRKGHSMAAYRHDKAHQSIQTSGYIVQEILRSLPTQGKR